MGDCRSGCFSRETELSSEITKRTNPRSFRLFRVVRVPPFVSVANRAAVSTAELKLSGSDRLPLLSAREPLVRVLEHVGIAGQESTT